ncbi:MAG TPA: hypothetical protein VF108_05835 [Actinomycetota bacterium]
METDPTARMDTATDTDTDTGSGRGTDIDTRTPEEEPTPETTGLLQEQDGDAFRARWDEIQVRFVDEPRESVEHADQLVAELMERLTTTFDEERRSLESRWDSGDDVSTEDLRIVLQRYRSFFGRLLAA